MPNQFAARYAQLNSAQKQAVDTIEGPVLVVAGPGSGKTELLTLRIANILQQADVGPGNILCLTFTDAAASNMRERLRSLIGDTGNKVAIHTFHSFGSEIIAKYPEYFFQGATFTSADDLAQISILESLLQALPYDNQLRSEHPDEGFNYLTSIKEAISNLKRAGLTPLAFREVIEENSKCLEQLNPRIHNLFDGRLSIAQLPEIRAFITQLEQESAGLLGKQSLIQVVGNSLRSALEESEQLAKMAPLSAWKSNNLKKSDRGERVLIDSLHLETLRTLVDIYAGYQAGLYREQLFDYNDMLLRVIQTIEQEPTLAAELQERYQYVLVDEFQDTNDAQLQLLASIVDSPVNEGRPNLLAVGDDDQAIYKFQGAELANILQFKNQYRDPELIVLTANYRSCQNILDLSKKLISQAQERLETVVPEITKELYAAGTDQPGLISALRFTSQEQQYLWVVEQISEKTKQGHPLSQIAVISRHHKELQSFVPYLEQAGIAMRYERKQNVIDDPHIHQLIVMARFVVSLSRHQRLEADYLLPEILSFPCFAVPSIKLWQLGITAYKEQRFWIDLMLDDDQLAPIATFLIDLSCRSLHEPLEIILNELIGGEQHLVLDNEDEDLLDTAFDRVFRSPFKEYYFGADRFEKNRLEYITFLSSLRTFVNRLREYKQGEQIVLDDLLEFVDTHIRNKLAVLDSGELATGIDCVQLLTAHKAKGLEFESVFILNCTDAVWAGRGRSSKIRFPINLPLLPSSDSTDDQLRLYYVALTRCKRQLNLTTYQKNEQGKDLTSLQFLPADIWKDASNPSLFDTLKAATKTSSHQPIKQESRSLLLHQLEHYVLNVTHLNNFLDVAHAGPQAFLEQNLLRFPQPKSISGAFGLAVHASLHQVNLFVRKEGRLPKIDQLLLWFEQQLTQQRLSDEDFRLLSERGFKALTAFFTKYQESFLLPAESERDFRSQNIHLANVPITGKIDRLTKQGNQLTVHDYKTGNPARSFQGKDGNERIKLWKYRRQLIFYKLLVEQAHDYQGQEVILGRLEFIEPQRNTGELLQLETGISSEETTRLASLIQVVYGKIMNLDFPRIDEYPKDLSGIQEFEEDLLTGRI